MQETQAELTDAEIDFFETLLSLLEGQKETVLTIQDIASKMKVKPYEKITDKGLLTWAGQKIRQFGLSDGYIGRRNGKKAYLFDVDKVKSIFLRYNQISNQGCKVVSDLQNQGFASDNLLKTGCMDTTSGCHGYDTLQPLQSQQNEVVLCNTLESKGVYNLTTSATYIYNNKKNPSLDEQAQEDNDDEEEEFTW